MSKICKRKHVMNEYMWDDETLPKENQSIVKVLKSCGNNLHEVQTPSRQEYLVSMPVKFRHNIWVKRGNYVLVEPIPEGNKVKGEVVKILNKKSISYYKENNIWPKEFDDGKQLSTEDSDCDLFVNTNRLNYYDDSDSIGSDVNDSSDNTDSGEEIENVTK